MRLDIITIFPEYLEPLEISVVGRARTRGLVDIVVHDLRDWATDRHRTVDDTPYGGGPGMVMRPDVWGEALDAVLADASPAQVHLIVPTPSGRPFTQPMARTLAQPDAWLVFACGRYEGIDARVMEHYATDPRIAGVHEVSIGDYVLAGGEAAVLVMVEAIGRLLPGVLGNADSAHDDSFSPGADGLLEGPVFTKPAQWRGLTVPEVLVSGDHARVARWRRERSRERTESHRPDLL